MTSISLADKEERDDLGAFVARAVRLDGQSVIRLRNRGEAYVEAWVSTPFDALATRTVRGQATPGDVTVSGATLLTALSIVRDEAVDPGPVLDLQWRAALPHQTRWQPADGLPAGEA